jgi:hypothetical protein
MNIDMVQAAGITISLNPSGKWFISVDPAVSRVGAWADTPDEVWAAFPGAVEWRIGFISDRIAADTYYPEEPAELEWLKRVAGR